MCLAALAVAILGLVSARDEITSSRGLDRILALVNLSIAVPLAVFSVLHFVGPEFVSDVVPPFMPWRMFRVHSAGAALMSTALSVAARIEVRLSGLPFGLMMFPFVAMVHLPGAICGSVISGEVARQRYTRPDHVHHDNSLAPRGAGSSPPLRARTSFGWSPSTARERGASGGRVRG